MLRAIEWSKASVAPEVSELEDVVAISCSWTVSLVLESWSSRETPGSAQTRLKRTEHRPLLP